MISGLILDEFTDTYALSIVEFPREREYVAELFIKGEGYLWYGVLRYAYLPPKEILFRDIYALKCQSPRPYKPAQACDGSISAPVLHLFNQLCEALKLDPLALYREAYNDHVLTAEELAETIRFAEWQGVEIIDNWTSEVIGKIMESLHEVNMHQLANLLEEKVAI